MVHLLAWWRPSTEDRLVVAVLRTLGVLAVALLILGVVGVVALIDTLAGPDTGWEGLIVGAIVLVGGGAILIGSALWGYAVATARHPQGAVARIGAWVLVVLGLAAWYPLLTKAPTAPLDHYVAILGLVLALAGAILAWRLSRSRSRPA